MVVPEASTQLSIKYLALSTVLVKLGPNFPQTLDFKYVLANLRPNFT